ncbi:MAG: ATP-binding protein [Chloroflexota bacterium]
MKPLIISSDKENNNSESAKNHYVGDRQFKYLGLLAGGVAHRVGSKSGLIRLHLQKLKSILKSEEVDVLNIIEKIEKENEYLLELSDALFIPAQSAIAPKVQVHLEQLLTDAIKRVSIPSDYTLLLGNIDTPYVAGNQWLIEVFCELFSNAIRAMANSDEKYLSISAKLEKNNFVVVYIEDSGLGIHSEEIPKLFNLFYSRGNGDISQRRGGFGLWYSKSIITQLGGDILIESELDKGTVVKVCLPVYQ